MEKTAMAEGLEKINLYQKGVMLKSTETIEQFHSLKICCNPDFNNTRNNSCQLYKLDSEAGQDW